LEGVGDRGELRGWVVRRPRERETFITNSTPSGVTISCLFKEVIIFMSHTFLMGGLVAGASVVNSGGGSYADPLLEQTTWTATTVCAVAQLSRGPRLDCGGCKLPFDSDFGNPSKGDTHPENTPKARKYRPEIQARKEPVSAPVASVRTVSGRAHPGRGHKSFM